MKVNRSGIFGVLLLIAGLFSVIRLHGSIPWFYYLMGTMQYIGIEILMQKDKTKLSFSYCVGNHIFYSMIIIGLFSANFTYLKIIDANSHLDIGGYQNIWYAWYLASFVFGVVLPSVYEFLLKAYQLRKWKTLTEILLIACCVLWTIVVSTRALYIPIFYLLIIVVHTAGIRWIKAENAWLKWGSYVFYIMAIGFMLFGDNDVLMLAMYYVLAVVMGYGSLKMLFPGLGDEKVQG